MRQMTYTHCDCGRLVQLARLGDDADANGALKALGGAAYGGACPTCGRGATLTLIPPEKDRPRIIKPT